MRTVAKCAAVASIVLLTAGSAAWAQGCGNNTGNYGNQSYNQGYNPGYQGANSGNWGDNQAGWAKKCRAAATSIRKIPGLVLALPTTRIMPSQRELAQYGYTDIHNLRPTQGWSADAMKNGRMVHVILGENGLVSTFRGVNENRTGEANWGLQNRSTVENRLSQYGYDNIHNLTPIPSWSADAKKNGEWVQCLDRYEWPHSDLPRRAQRAMWAAAARVPRIAKPAATLT